MLGGIAWLFMIFVAGALFIGSLAGQLGSEFAAFTGVFTIVAIIGAAIEFGIAGALFSGKSWGRTIVMFLAVIDLIIQIISLIGGNFFSILAIILDSIVLWYLRRDYVVAWFNKKNS